MTTLETLPTSPPQATAAAAIAQSAKETESRRRAGRRILVIVIAVAIVVGIALAAGTIPRLKRDRQLKAAAAEVATALPRVTVAIAEPSSRDVERELPGNALPFTDASLFARTNGYIIRWLADIGDRVEERQLLAEISAPDVDDQLAQARANLELARANLTFAEANAEVAQITLDRLVKSGPGTGSTLLQIDQQRATVKTTAAQVDEAKATIHVNEATVKQFEDEQSFQKILAPFPGVITARNIDPGDLITADSPNTTMELFHIMRTDILRVFVDVPQEFATEIKVGQKAVVYRREEPLRQYAGTVDRTANALDPNTRTLRTQVNVPNPHDELRPGMYLQVKFVVTRDIAPLLIPTAALAIRTGGPRVAVLDDQNRVQYRTIQLGRDYGLEVEVVSGLSPHETVVVHPGDDLAPGTKVEPIALPKANSEVKGK